MTATEIVERLEEVKAIIEWDYSLEYQIALDGAIENFKLKDRPKGEWIEHKWAEEVNEAIISNYECSNCHSWERNNSNFCPNCGGKNER